MKLNSIELLSALDAELKTLIEKSERIFTEPESVLRKNPDKDGWNVLECYEHLNRYSAYYIPEIRKSVNRAKKTRSTSYKTGFLGNFSAKQMLPENGTVDNKMNTFKSKNPSLDQVKFDKAVISQFLSDQEKLRELLTQAKKVDLGRTKVKTTLPLIKFKLGDVLRFHINHEVRHMTQIERTLNVVMSTEEVSAT